MKSREKILAIGVAGLLAVLGLRAAYSYIDDSFAQRQKRLDALQQEVGGKQLEVAKGLKAGKSLTEWQTQSLPTDRNAAASLYQSWLLKIADNAGVRDVKLSQPDASRQQIGQRIAVRGKALQAYERVNFTLNCEATLKQIVRLLYDFYSANHLQRIARLDISPAERGGELSLIVNVEALILPGADRIDKLNDEKSDRLTLGELAAYENAIVGRNLFAEYKPPVVAERRRDPPRPAPKPAFDQAKHATVTGITEQGNQPQLWVLVKTTGELLKLAEGEEFTIGDLKCKVVRIGLRDAELANGDKHFLVKLQDNLRDAATATSGEI